MNIHTARRYVSPRTRPLTAEERYTRAIAYAVKEPRRYPEMLAVAAAEMAAMLDDEPALVLVPIPTSGGDTAPNRALANAIAERVSGRATVRDVLRRAVPVESSCVRRRAGLPGLTEKEHHFTRAGRMLPLVPLYFVDNVTTTGATLRAARAALGYGDAVVFADATPPRSYQPEEARTD